MHAGREDRIDEAGGVAGQQVAGAVEAVAAVGVVADDAHRADEARVAQPLRDRRAGGDRGGGRAPSASPAASPAKRLASTTAPTLVRAVVQRNEPEPAVGEGGGEDVAAQRAGQPLGLLVVAEHRQVLEERVEAAQLVAPAEQRLLAAGVDHPGRLGLAPRAPSSSMAVHAVARPS